MVARLHAFYGTAPHPSMDWAQVPARWFWAYVEMMPRLAAEQALGRRSEIAAGTGSMSEADQRSYLADLRRAVDPHPQRPERPMSAEAIAAIGINVTEH